MAVLNVIWLLDKQPCGKCLVPVLPVWLTAYQKRHGLLDEEVESLCGPSHRPDADSENRRTGSKKGSVYPDGPKGRYCVRECAIAARAK